MSYSPYGHGPSAGRQAIPVRWEKVGVFDIMPEQDQNEKTGLPNGKPGPEDELPPTKAKFEVYGEEMIEKVVKLSGNSGRVYLPPDWVGKIVKIIRID